MLIAIIKDALITVGDYRSLFPNTSFRESGPSAEFMAENGCLPVTTWKAHDKTQKLVSAEPYIEDGQVFTVRVESKTAEELAAEQNNKAAQVRQQRDAELARSDWRVVKSVETGEALDAAWATYRQALRDITAQPGFPDVEFPKSPDLTQYR